MSNYGDLLPAYRDYKTAKEAKEAFLAGKDWIISSFHHPDCGRYINVDQCRPGETVILRFCRQTKITGVKVPKRKTETQKLVDELNKPGGFFNPSQSGQISLAAIVLAALSALCFIVAQFAG